MERRAPLGRRVASRRSQGILAPKHRWAMSESTFDSGDVNLARMPKSLREQLRRANGDATAVVNPLAVNAIHCGDAAKLLPRIERNSIALSVWSPPYFVGKDY